VPLGALIEATEDAVDERRYSLEAKLRALCLGGATWPVVCMLRAGLYVGLGAFGIAAARLVSNGSLAGNSGPPKGMPRGPDGLPFMPFDRGGASKE
jgi:hypothetical protein